MEPRYRLRLYLLTASVLVGFGALLTRLHDFQINRRSEFIQKMPGDRKVTIREPGVRGEITDRNGIVLARNVRDYEVTFNLQEIYEAYRRQHNETPELVRLVKERGMDRSRKERDIVGIVNEFIIPRLQDHGIARNYSAGALRAHYLTHGGLVPFSYRTDLTYEEFARFAEFNQELPGVYLRLHSQRQYPYGSLASHVIGYLKQWEKGDIPEDASRKYDHYIGEPKGIAGIELTMDNLLRGPEGRREMLRDEKGAIRGIVGQVRPGNGARLELTLDARIQYLTEQTLRNAGRAAAVVMDVETGEILAMASVPDYNPNDFIPSIDSKQYDAYLKNKAKPLMNRCISNFTPGSTFKLGTAISAAIKGQATRVYSCNGFVTYGNARVGCWIWNQSKGSHGSENLSVAIRNSCNPYFNLLANSIGSKAMTDGFTMLGFGKPSGLPLPDEKEGVIIGNRAWRASRPGKSPTQHDVALFSIGQSVLATPLQLCKMVTAIANGGKLYQPRIVRRAVAMDGKEIIRNEPKVEVDLLKEGVKTSDLALIREGMRLAVNQGGTATPVKLPDIVIAAKTGTAQVSIIQKTHHCWTVGFAPYENPKYAVVVMVQDGGSGGKVAGPLLQHIIRGIIERDRGNRLPLEVETPYGGHMNRIEAIASLEKVPTTTESGAGEEGETAGNEDTEATPDNPPVVPDTDTTPIPTPTIAPEVDAEGTIPRAIPVR